MKIQVLIYLPKKSNYNFSAGIKMSLYIQEIESLTRFKDKQSECLIINKFYFCKGILTKGKFFDIHKVVPIREVKFLKYLNKNHRACYSVYNPSLLKH